MENMTAQQRIDRLVSINEHLHQTVDELVSTVCILNLLDRKKHITSICVLEERIEHISGRILKNDAKIQGQKEELKKMPFQS